MRVTVCVPAYQSAGFLSETLKSLQAQTFSEWQCHIVDDASDDLTIAIAERFAAKDSRFKVRQNAKRLGAAANWNESIKGVTTEYVKLLCSDDVLAPNALASGVEALDHNVNATYAAGKRDVIDDDGRTLWRNRGLWRGARPVAGAAAMRRFVRTGVNLFGEPSFGLYRTSALQQAGGFDEKWSYLIDVASYRDVLQLGDFVPINETLGAFRVRNSSWSASLVGRQAQETRAMVREVGTASWVKASKSDIALGEMRASLNAMGRRPFFLFAEAVATGKTKG
jgi:glycosyltransferase involved in cell wall biosynthesis